MNQPAFPFVAEDETGTMLNMGMSLRDYFAAKAMQGLLMSTKTSDANMIVKDSYSMADAMLKARKE